MQMVYGGKVLDNFDRRTLLAYLDEYLGDFLFDSFQPFHFYKGNDREHYTIPYAAGIKADFLGKWQLVSIFLPYIVLKLFVLFYLLLDSCPFVMAKRLELIEMQF